MKNKIVISIGSLLACIAFVSVLIAAVGPPPILRNAMTTNQNVWEKSGSTLSYTGAVNVAGPASSATTGTESSNLVTYAQMQSQTNNLVPPGVWGQIPFNSNGVYASSLVTYTNGNVGIGISGNRLPLGPLEVSGKANTMTGGRNALILNHEEIANDHASDILLVYNTTNLLFQIGCDTGANGGQDFYMWNMLNVPAGPILYSDTNNLRGMGTTTPKSALDVVGGISAGAYAGSVAAPANGFITSGRGGFGTSNPKTLLQSGSAETGAPDNIGELTLAKTLGGAHRKFKMGIDTNFNLSIGDFGSNSDDTYAPAMTIQIDGKVGIGTNAPHSAMHWVGDLTITGATTNTPVSSTPLFYLEVSLNGTNLFIPICK